MLTTGKLTILNWKIIEKFIPIFMQSVGQNITMLFKVSFFGYSVSCNIGTVIVNDTLITPTFVSSFSLLLLQSNFNGSNTFGTMKISSRQGYFELMSFDNSARSGGILKISLIFYNMKVCCVFSLESPQ